MVLALCSAQTLWADEPVLVLCSSMLYDLFGWWIVTSFSGRTWQRHGTIWNQQLEGESNPADTSWFCMLPLSVHLLPISPIYFHPRCSPLKPASVHLCILPLYLLGGNITNFSFTIHLISLETQTIAGAYLSAMYLLTFHFTLTLMIGKRLKIILTCFP